MTKIKPSGKMVDTMVLSGILPEGTPGVDNYVDTGNRCSDDEILLSRATCFRQYLEGKMRDVPWSDEEERLFICAPDGIVTVVVAPLLVLRTIIKMCGLNDGARWAGTKSATHGKIDIGRTQGSGL